MSNIRKYLFIFLIINGVKVIGKQCECILYSKTLSELNKEYDKLFKPYYLATTIDSTFDPTNPPFNSDTFYTSKYTTNNYKFFISDKINNNYWCKGFIDFMASEYKHVSDDSLFKINNYNKAQSINLSNCRFNEVDSVFYLHFDGTNYFELKEKANSSFSIKIIEHKRHNDTINYSPIIIYFSEIVYLNKDLAYFNIRYDFSQRQSAKSVFFRKIKNKWKFYKFGKESTF